MRTLRSKPPLPHRLARIASFVVAVLVIAGTGPATASSSSPHGSLELDCTLCHDPSAWKPLKKPAQFRHLETGFELVGAHAQVGCRSCHQSLVFAEIGTACADCHKDAHRGELGSHCESCHAPRTWSVATALGKEHDRTRFPLVGIHRTLDCESCHRGQRPFEYATTPTECFGCHSLDYAAAAQPNHVLAGFSRQCEDCHRQSSRTWRELRPGAFDHPSSFALRGAHASASCSGCHASGYAGTPRDCVACHRDDYDGARDPNHSRSGFSTSCQSCHSESGWKPAAFNHAQSRFPLTGAHAGVDCARCHSAGYSGTPTDCVACHRDDYDRTSNPNHAASRFPTACQTCHATSAWRPASFDHNRTRFPLTGAHVPLDCARCHSSGYSGTPSDCVACHRDDYDRTASPNHAAARFPTACQGCHQTSAWRPASFDHDGRYFPINSGEHAGTWASCDTCHVQPGNFSVFECTVCHDHRKSEMDDEHRGVSGYQYRSSSCYFCHPRGDR